MNKILLLFCFISFLITPIVSAPQNTGTLTFSVFLQPSERSEYIHDFGARSIRFYSDSLGFFELDWDSNYEIVFKDLHYGVYQIEWLDQTDEWNISFSQTEIWVELGHSRVNALIEQALDNTR